MKAPIIYVDVDDTFVRTVGSKRIPMPATIRHIRELKQQGATLYCWSSGGAAYVQSSARVRHRRVFRGVSAQAAGFN